MKSIDQATISKNSSIAIYVQVKEILKKLIINKIFKPDERIPSENELSSKFEISRMTVRQAIKELVKEGYLYIKRGEGTFVYRSEKSQMLIKLDGFSREMTKLGFSPFSKILNVEKITSYKGHESAYKGLDEKPENSIILIKRLRYLDNVPFAIESSYLKYNMGKALLEKDFTPLFSIYRYLEDECNVVLSKAVHTIEPKLVNKENALLLDMERGAAVLIIKGTTYSNMNKPVEYLSGIYRGNKYKLKIEIKK